ncbi:MAG: hypothetical protein KAH18_09855 [Psychromonas sp.]|nr:hypothetical protein [Psychromonas sp.]
MKIKNKLIISTLLLVSLVLVACKAKEKNKFSPFSPGLDGTWTYLCTPDLTDPNTSTNEIQTYNNNQIEQNLTIYNDSKCIQPIINTKIKGDFTLGETVDRGSNDEHTKIDRTGHELVVTILDSNTVRQANAKQLGDFGFGITNWKKDEPKVLTSNKLAIEYYLLGSTEFDIFKLTSNKLFNGDLNGDLDADGRPINLDRSAWGMRN